MCLLAEYWPNLGGKINQDRVHLVVDHERFPLKDFNSGYCPQGCSLRVAPGERWRRLSDTVTLSFLTGWLVSQKRLSLRRSRTNVLASEPRDYFFCRNSSGSMPACLRMASPAATPLARELATAVRATIRKLGPGLTTPTMSATRLASSRWIGRHAHDRDRVSRGIRMGVLSRSSVALKARGQRTGDSGLHPAQA